VKDGATKNTTAYKAANAGLVAMDPKTGQVLAMVGSKDYFAPSEPAGCISGKSCVFEPNVNVAVSLYSQALLSSLMSILRLLKKVSHRKPTFGMSTPTLAPTTEKSMIQKTMTAKTRVSCK